jgi:hypothetical protein
MLWLARSRNPPKGGGRVTTGVLLAQVAGASSFDNR